MENEEWRMMDAAMMLDDDVAIVFKGRKYFRFTPGDAASVVLGDIIDLNIDAVRCT